MTHEHLIIEETKAIVDPKDEQHVLDGCNLRVRATIAEIFGYERAMSETVETSFVETFTGARFASATCLLDRAEVEAAGFTIDEQASHLSVRAHE